MKFKTLMTTFFCLLAFIAFGQDTLQSSNLPIIVIQTDEPNIVDEPKIGGHMGIIYHENGQRNYLTEAFNHYDGRIGIELRGQSSLFFFDKKSYGVETRDANGDDLSVSLFGMPEESDWVLYGPYSDKTMVRNTLIYKLSNEIGQYAVRTKFCELVVNNEYKGVFVWMEKIKRDKNRVDIEKLKTDEISGEDLTGGYILRLDKFEEGKDINLWYSAFAGDKEWMRYQVVYPKGNDLQEEQLQYIQGFIYDFEAALTSNQYQDPAHGFRKYIDVPSFIDFMLLNELARNPDGYRLSTYLYKQNDKDGGKLHMGPIWDFNIAMGNADFCLGGGTSGWVLNYNSICPEDFWLMGYWWDRLLADPDFVAQLQARWAALRQSAFSLSNIHETIDEMAAEVGEAQPRDNLKWQTIGNYIWPNSFIGNSYGAEVTHLKEWFEGRVAWIDDNIGEISGQIKGPYSFFKQKIYPNPFTDRLVIEVETEVASDIEFRLFNTLGQQVTELTLSVADGLLYQWEVPSSIVGKLSGGVYFYQIWINGVLHSEGKLVKKGE